MTVQAQLSTDAENKLSAFATSLLFSPKTMKYGDDILGLRKTFKDPSALPADVRNQLIEKINRNPKETIAQARDMIDKNPAILQEFNKDPMKLAAAMGVKPASPVTPVVVAAAPPAVAAGAPAATPPRTETPASRPVMTKNELATERQILSVHAEISENPAYQELMLRAEKDPELDKVITAMREGKDETPAQTLKNLTELRDSIKANPAGLKELVDVYDTTPINMRAMGLEILANRPEMARDIVQNKEGAKDKLTEATMQRMQQTGQDPMSSIFGNLFGGKGLQGLMQGGGGGLNGIFAGLKTLFENIGPMLMGGISKLLNSSGLMRMGSGAALTAGLVMSLGPNDPQAANKLITDANTGLTATAAQVRKTEPVEPGAPTPIGPATPTMAKLDPRLSKGPGGMDGPGGSNFG